MGAAGTRRRGDVGPRSSFAVSLIRRLWGDAMHYRPVSSSRRLIEASSNRRAWLGVSFPAKLILIRLPGGR
jgi:hypothetical protein